MSRFNSAQRRRESSWMRDRDLPSGLLLVFACLCVFAPKVSSVRHHVSLVLVLIAQQRVLARRLAYEIHIGLKLATAFAHFQMNAQTPSLEPAEAAILFLRDQMRNLSAGQHRIFLG